MYAQPTVTASCTMTSSWLTRLLATLRMIMQPEEHSIVTIYYDYAT